MLTEANMLSAPNQNRSSVKGTSYSIWPIGGTRIPLSSHSSNWGRHLSFRLRTLPGMNVAVAAREQLFVQENSVVRRIWGKSDTVLFIFAGAAAEFALNKAVDWLYFTGRLPADPIGRLFSTVAYARRIVFSPAVQANKAIDTMRQIHEAVEAKRGATIPDWAYRDVLYMLIHYSIAAYELLEAPLSPEDKQEVYDVFYRVGSRMGLKELPENYTAWLPARAAHLATDLQLSGYTGHLFAQYRRQLGAPRYALLVEAQKMLVPDMVWRQLPWSRIHWLAPALPCYKLCRRLGLDGAIKKALLPAAYLQQIQELDMPQASAAGSR